MRRAVRIAIIGGLSAGLLRHVPLRRRGFEFMFYEAPELKEIGAGWRSNRTQ